MRDTSLFFRDLLTKAIARQVLVEIRYDQDPEPRLFAPHVLVRAPGGNINATGMQYRNPTQPLDDQTVRTFTLDRITTLGTTETYFRPSPQIVLDRYHAPVAIVGSSA
jgi:hypothetical protein